MSRFLPQALIRTTSTASLLSKPSAIRRLTTQPDNGSFVEVTLTEANLVEKVEDAIHSLIVKKSRPDWLPLVPGASYWVPPRRSSYGVTEMVKQVYNPLNEEQLLALTSVQGWPSSDFYVNNDVHTPEDVEDSETQSTRSSEQEDES